MATPDDTETQTAPPPAAPAEDPTSAYLRQALAQLTAAPPQVQPDTTPVKRGWLSLLGEGLGGGQETGAMSPAQSESAGLRSLMQFGTGLMAASHYQPGQTAFSNLAQGFQGAGQSERGSEQMAAGQLAAQQGYQMKQQELQMERLKAALPLLTLQQQAQMASNARNLASGPAVPGTGSGAGGPATIAPPAVAYGQGGPGSTIPVPPEYMQYFQDAAKRNNMPVDLLIAQARQESGFNPNAAGGLMSILPTTATKPGFGLTGVQNPDVLRDPKTNINFGADYLAARAKAIGADLNTPEGQAKALQAYNGGGDPKYVQNVTRYMPKPGGGPAPGQYAGPGVPAGGAPAAPAAPPPVPPAAPAGGPPGAAPAVPAAPGATTQPAVTPPPAQPPPPSPRPDIPIPGGGAISDPGDFNAYRDAQYKPPTGEEYNPNVAPETLQAFAAKRQALDLQRQNIANLPLAKQPEAVDAWKTADAALTADQNNAIAAKKQAASVALNTYIEKQNTDIAARHKTLLDAYNTAAQGQLTSQNKISEINAQSDATAAGKALQDINTSTAGAQDVVNQGQMVMQLSKAAGTPGFLSTWPTAAQALVRANLLSPGEVSSLGAQAGLDAATNRLIETMKGQAGFSRFTDRDLRFLQNTAPASFTPEQIREPMLAATVSAAQRQAKYGHLVNSLHAGGMPVWKAEEEADKQTPSIIQQPPSFDKIADPNAKLAAQGQWVNQNVPVGSFYLKPNGKLGIRSAAQQPQGQGQQ